jgi:hypothetical protein
MFACHVTTIYTCPLSLIYTNIIRFTLVRRPYVSGHIHRLTIDKSIEEYCRFRMNRHQTFHACPTTSRQNVELRHS